jgi:ABC-type ATPase involved in cell division
VALAKRPAVLLVDEPTANLDPVSARKVADVLAQHCRQGMACVVSTHDEQAFAGVAVRGAFIDGGRLETVPCD